MGLACVLSSTALFAADATHADARDLRWVRPRVVRPAYPPEALAKGQTGTVTVEGVAGPDGRFDEVSYTAEPPESALFIDAVVKVVPKWLFHNSNGECVPDSVRFRTKVAFQIENGKPRILVTNPPAPNEARTAPAANVKPAAHLRPIHAVKIEYPEAMRRRHYSGKTYAKLMVDRDGTVTSVEARTWPRPATADAGVFNLAAERALKDWKFPPVPPEEKAPWVHCHEYTWQLVRESENN